MANAWAAVVKFFTDNPLARMLAWLILFLLGWEVVKRHLKEAGKQAERAAIAKKQAEVRVRVNERSTEIINEERTHADQALEARDDSRPAPPFDQLPDEVQRILNRSARGHQAS
jgi:hypothetical protein